MNVFLRNESGLLYSASAHRFDGDWYIGGARVGNGTSLTPTGRIERLIGWGESDGDGIVCETDYGVDVIVPSKFSNLIS